MNTNTSPVTLSTGTTVADDPTNISPRPEADIKPRSEWDEDEIFDGRPRAATIEILVVPPGAAPYTHTLDNTLEAMQALIGGYITSFETGIFDAVGIAHDEGLLLRLPPNRLIPATGAVIFGTFFVAGSGINLHSLTDEQMSEAAKLFEHPLRLQQLAQLLQRQRANSDTND